MEANTGDTPLLSACRLGRVEIVSMCLLLGGKNDPHPDFGQTALQAAVSAGHANCVKLILDTAAPSESDAIIVNHEDANKEAPIHVASRCGNSAVLELLVIHGANLHLVDFQGRTAVHCAAMGGHKQCLVFLLDAGGDELIEEVSDWLLQSATSTTELTLLLFHSIRLAPSSLGAAGPPRPDPATLGREGEQDRRR